MLHKVLVVDDDKVLQQSVRQALEHHQFQVKTADNGKEALQAVYREKFDLVVMDVNHAVALQDGQWHGQPTGPAVDPFLARLAFLLDLLQVLS